MERSALSSPDVPPYLQIIGLVLGTITAVMLPALRWLSSRAGKDELAKVVSELKRQNETVLERVDNHYQEARDARDRLADKIESASDKLFIKIDSMDKAIGATMVAVSHIQGRLDEEEKTRRQRRTR